MERLILKIKKSRLLGIVLGLGVAFVIGLLVFSGGKIYHNTGMPFANATLMSALKDWQPNLDPQAYKQFADKADLLHKAIKAVTKGEPLPEGVSLATDIVEQPFKIGEADAYIVRVEGITGQPIVLLPTGALKELEDKGIPLDGKAVLMLEQPMPKASSAGNVDVPNLLLSRFADTEDMRKMSTLDINKKEEIQQILDSILSGYNTEANVAEIYSSDYIIYYVAFTKDDSPILIVRTKPVGKGKISVHRITTTGMTVYDVERIVNAIPVVNTEIRNHWLQLVNGLLEKSLLAPAPSGPKGPLEIFSALQRSIGEEVKTVVSFYSAGGTTEEKSVFERLKIRPAAQQPFATDAIFPEITTLGKLEPMLPLQAVAGMGIKEQQIPVSYEFKGLPVWTQAQKQNLTNQSELNFNSGVIFPVLLPSAPGYEYVPSVLGYSPYPKIYQIEKGKGFLLLQEHNIPPAKLKEINTASELEEVLEKCPVARTIIKPIEPGKPELVPAGVGAVIIPMEPLIVTSIYSATGGKEVTITPFAAFKGPTHYVRGNIGQGITFMPNKQFKQEVPITFVSEINPPYNLGLAQGQRPLVEKIAQTKGGAESLAKLLSKEISFIPTTEDVIRLNSLRAQAGGLPQQSTTVTLFDGRIALKELLNPKVAFEKVLGIPVKIPVAKQASAGEVKPAAVLEIGTGLVTEITEGKKTTVLMQMEVTQPIEALGIKFVSVPVKTLEETNRILEKLQQQQLGKVAGFAEAINKAPTAEERQKLIANIGPEQAITQIGAGTPETMQVVVVPLEGLSVGLQVMPTGIPVIETEPVSVRYGQDNKNRLILEDLDTLVVNLGTEKPAYAPTDFAVQIIADSNTIASIENSNGTSRYFRALYSNRLNTDQIKQALQQAGIPVSIFGAIRGRDMNIVEAVNSLVDEFNREENVHIGLEDIILRIADANRDLLDLLSKARLGVLAQIIMEPGPGEYVDQRKSLIQAIQVLEGQISPDVIRTLVTAVENAVEIRGTEVRPEKDKDETRAKMQQMVKEAV